MGADRRRSGNGCDAPTAITYGSNPAAGNTFMFGGNRFYFETYGRGMPVLLIHGNGASISEFKGQIGPFSRSHQVIAMDSRGQGKSELGTTALTYEGMAEDINALLEHLELNHVKVLGQSDGGIILDRRISSLRRRAVPRAFDVRG